MADWLDTAFAVYDYGILGALHMAAERAGAFLTPLMKLVTLLGEKGLLMFLTALVLLCFARTRKLGLCVFGAVCCGALITNIVLKDMVARPRPFESYALYQQWWTQLGAPAEDGFSFPSGHVTAITAGTSALCLGCRRRNRPLLVAGAVVAVLLMALSRNYLMAHYPSDVLFACGIGLFSAFVAYAITLLIFHLLEEYDDIPLCADILDFDVRWIPDLLDNRRKTRELEALADDIEADDSFAYFTASERENDFAPRPRPEAEPDFVQDFDLDLDPEPELVPALELDLDLEPEATPAQGAHADPQPQANAWLDDTLDSLFDAELEEDEPAPRGKAGISLPKLDLKLPKLSINAKSGYKGKH